MVDTALQHELFWNRGGPTAPKSPLYIIMQLQRQYPHFIMEDLIMEVDITTNILSYTMCEVGTNKKWIGMCVQEVMQPFVY